MIENNNGEYAILYVDDEEKALKYFSKALADRFTVYTAGDVAEAEAVLKTKSDDIAVVISDQRMPGKNGVELLKQVRTEYPSMVRLLTTAYSDLNDAIEAINRGEIFRYIQKPWKVESLQAEIVGAMEYFLLRRERDLLLAEKLSARQRMAGMERVVRLVVFARTFKGLRHTDHAMKAFLHELHTLPNARESDGLGRVDQWELTKWEVKRITDYLRQVTDDLLEGNDSADRFDDVLTPERLLDASKTVAEATGLAASLDSDIDSDPDRPAEAMVNLALLEKLVINAATLYSQIHDPARPVSMKIAFCGKSAGEQAIVLSFHAAAPNWPTDRHPLSGSALTEVHPVYKSLLTCALVASHHGGNSSFNFNNGALNLIINLPLSGDSSSLPELDWDWLPDVLELYEPAIDEFYHDL
ncbi:MAG: response regulator [Cellvibrionaceae bacterium]